MSALSSTSTIAQITASYADNASYEEDGSVSKARAFVTACRLLILKLPTKMMHGKAGEIDLDPSLIRGELQAAQRWLASQPDSAAGADAVRFLDFSTFRD